MDNLRNEPTTSLPEVTALEFNMIIAGLQEIAVPYRVSSPLIEKLRSHVKEALSLAQLKEEHP